MSVNTMGLVYSLILFLSAIVYSLMGNTDYAVYLLGAGCICGTIANK